MKFQIERRAFQNSYRETRSLDGLVMALRYLWVLLAVEKRIYSHPEFWKIAYRTLYVIVIVWTLLAL